MKPGQPFQLSYQEAGVTYWRRHPTWVAGTTGDIFLWQDRLQNPHQICGTLLELSELSTSEHRLLRLHEPESGRIIFCIYPNWRTRWRLWRAGRQRHLHT